MTELACAAAPLAQRYALRPLALACSLFVLTNGTVGWAAQNSLGKPVVAPPAETPPATPAPPLDRTKAGTTGAAGPPKLIRDTTLLLRPFKRDTGRTGACNQLLPTGRDEAWCGTLRFDVANPQREKQSNLWLTLEPATQVRTGSQPVTDAVVYQLAGDGCSAAQNGPTLTITAPAEGATCPVTLTVLSDAPGEYRTSLRSRDPTGAFDQSSTLTFKANESWLTVLGWLALGGLIGALLSYIRTFFQPHVATFGAALQLAQRYEAAAALARQSRLVPAARSTLLDEEVKRLLENARAGRSTEPAAGKAALSDHISALETWAALAQRATALEATRLKALAPRFEDILVSVLHGATPMNGLQELGAELQQALNDQQAGAQESVEAKAVARDASGPVTVPDFGRITFANIRTLDQLERRAFIASLIETVLTFLLFAVAALLALWVNNDAWGTSADILNAILIGAGAFLGATAIKSLHDGARA